MVTTKIQLKNHLAEYLNAKYWDDDLGCVCLPDKLDLYHTIWNLLEKRPIDCPRDTGNVELALPSRRIGKDPETYNYLGIRSVKIIDKRVETLFYGELRQILDENKNHDGIEYLDTIHEFINQYRIESITPDAIQKDFYRWRNTIRKRKRKREYKRS